MKIANTPVIFLAYVLLSVLPVAAQPVMPGGIPVLSGGVGADSAAEMKAREAQFNLKLVLTLMEGDYVSGAGVRITSGGKEVARHRAEGPFVLVRLPAGAYGVAVDYGGQTQTRNVQVRADRLTTEYVRFKRDAGDAPAPRE